VVVFNLIGVNTGEVVVGEASSGQRFATADAADVPVGLEQAAAVPNDGVWHDGETPYHQGRIGAPGFSDMQPW
jgi:hypothetical protein